jgi:hypothetical protein
MIDKHHQARIDERRQKVANLYLQGRTQRQIGAALGVDHSTVCRDLRALRRHWQQAAAGDFQERAAVELARIDHLETVAWAAWESSCQATVVRKTRKTKGRVSEDTVAQPDLVVAERVERKQAGDPRFLERVSWCIQRRLELMGLLKPEAAGVTTAVTVVNGVDIDCIVGRKPGLPIVQPSEN